MIEVPLFKALPISVKYSPEKFSLFSAAIIIKALKKIDQKFSMQIVKVLENDFIKKLPKDKITMFLDLGSGSLNQISEAGFKEVFIIDHHEIIQEVPSNLHIINPNYMTNKR